MEGFVPADTAGDADTKQEELRRARAAGWTETVAYDYDAFSRTGGNDGNWLGQGKVYEWSGDFGDVAPPVPELEKMLFGSDHILREGDHRAILDELEVAVEGPTKVQPITKVSP